MPSQVGERSFSVSKRCPNWFGGPVIPSQYVDPKISTSQHPAEDMFRHQSFCPWEDQWTCMRFLAGGLGR